MKHAIPSLFAALVVASVVLAPSEAAAQHRGDRLRLGVGPVLDFAGGVEYDPSPGGPAYDDDARITPGVRFHLDYDIARYVSLGGYARVSWWKGEDRFDNDRNLLFDIGARVNGHYDWRDFRFYGVLMLGPTISRVDRDNYEYYRRPYYYYGVDNPAVGLNVGIAPGVEYWFAKRAGLYLEMFGWNGHFFSHDRRNAAGDVNFRLNQVLWQFGLVFRP